MDLAEIHARTLRYSDARRVLREKGATNCDRKEVHEYGNARRLYTTVVEDPDTMLEVVELAMQATGEVATG